LRYGDRVTVVDPASAYTGREGVIVDFTRGGLVGVRFGDTVEHLHPVQIENDPQLIASATARPLEAVPAGVGDPA
jgi:hypothetical protein